MADLDAASRRKAAEEEASRTGSPSPELRAARIIRKHVGRGAYIPAAEAFGCAEEVVTAVRPRIEAESRAKVAAEEVLVEGSWFRRGALPEILGNFMRQSAQQSRELKQTWLHVAKLHAGTPDPGSWHVYTSESLGESWLHHTCPGSNPDVGVAVACAEPASLADLLAAVHAHTCLKPDGGRE